MVSSIYDLTSAPDPIPIALNVPAFADDIDISEDMVKPGGAGILRLYFSFIFDAPLGNIMVTNTGTGIGLLNADNDSEVSSKGYYRFDIGVVAGDGINLELRAEGATATEITTVNLLQAHLVQFGA